HHLLAVVLRQLRDHHAVSAAVPREGILMTAQHVERKPEPTSPIISAVGDAADVPVTRMATIGENLRFYALVLIWIPRTIRRYPREILNLLSEVTFGSGGLAVIGCTVGVMVGMSLFVGTAVGMHGYAALDQIGTSALNGFISAYFITREIAPLVAALALSATVGCGLTAQLAAMVITAEVVALALMAVPSIPYLVITRVIAGFIAII